MQISHRKITTGVRPHKIAVFVDNNSPTWKSSVEGIIEIFSSLWGGVYNIFIPTNGKEVEECFLNILREFNPDICCYYRYTKLDFYCSMEGATEKESIISSLVKEMRVSKIEAENILLAGIQKDENDIFKDNKEFVKYLSSKLSFFWRGNKPQLIKLYRRTKQSIGVIKVKHYLPELVERLDRSPTFFNLTNCSSSVRLLLANYWGLGELVFSNKVDVSKVTVERNFEESFIEQIYKGKDSSIAAFPISKYGLTEVSQINYFSEKTNCLLIVGESFADYALFYALNRIMRSVYWIPSVACFDLSISKLGFLTIERIVDEEISQGRQMVILSSYSVGELELTSIKEKIHELPISELHEDYYEIEIVPPDKIKIRREFDVYESDNYNNSYIQQFSNGISTGYIESPFPRVFKSLPVHSANWIIDYEIEGLTLDKRSTGHVLPKNDTLIRELFNQVGTTVYGPEVLRKNGFKYSILCPVYQWVYGHMTLRDITPKPIFCIQDKIEIFRTLFSEAGYDIEFSDKANYLHHSMDLAGGMEGLIHLLNDNEVCAFLSCYLDARLMKGRIENDIKGVRIKSGVYLSYIEIESFFSSKRSARSYMNHFIERGILTRGFIFRCQHCQNAEWYNINNVTDKFTCNRCERQQIYLPEHWKMENEPTFYYRLNEMFFLGFKNNMKVPLLGLAYLEQLSLKSYYYLPELDVWPLEEADKFEIDLVCLVDGEIYIGEAKSGSTQKKDIDKYLHVCNKLNAKFILVTTSVISDGLKQYIYSLSWLKPPVINEVGK